jgi:hypothetical protein
LLSVAVRGNQFRELDENDWYPVHPDYILKFTSDNNKETREKLVSLVQATYPQGKKKAIAELIAIACMCLNINPHARPTVKAVFFSLLRAAEYCL